MERNEILWSNSLHTHVGDGFDCSFANPRGFCERYDLYDSKLNGGSYRKHLRLYSLIIVNDYWFTGLECGRAVQYQTYKLLLNRTLVFP